MRRSVALLAIQAGVLTLQVIAGQAVVEFLLRRLPVDEGEFLAIVFEVTAYAVLPVGILHLHSEVVAMLIGQRFGNFFVAFEALVGGGAGAEHMAGVALRGTGKGGMSFGKRTGRNLRVQWRGKDKPASGDHQPKSDESSHEASDCW